MNRSEQKDKRMTVKKCRELFCPKAYEGDQHNDFRVFILTSKSVTRP